jgi:hypothetical protein
LSQNSGAENKQSWKKLQDRPVPGALLRGKAVTNFVKDSKRFWQKNFSAVIAFLQRWISPCTLKDFSHDLSSAENFNSQQI